jgi:uncharacterized protein
MRRLDLRGLRFDERDEAWRRVPVEVGPFVFGGLEYVVEGGAVDLDLAVARVGDRLTLTGSFTATLIGPCQRCLGEARLPVQARAIEVALRGHSEGVEDEEAYVAGYALDLDHWVRDMIASTLPEKLLCGEECRGLCPVCGADLNRAAPGHSHP